MKGSFLNKFKEILNLFVNFPQITLVTTVINIFTMGKKLSYAMAVKIGLIKNVLDLHYINILDYQQVVIKLVL